MNEWGFSKTYPLPPAHPPIQPPTHPLSVSQPCTHTHMHTQLLNKPSWRGVNLYYPTEELVYRITQNIYSIDFTLSLSWISVPYVHIISPKSIVYLRKANSRLYIRSKGCNWFTILFRKIQYVLRTNDISLWHNYAILGCQQHQSALHPMTHSKFINKNQTKYLI